MWDESKLDKPSSLLKYNVHSSFQSLPLEAIQTIGKQQTLPCALMFYNLNGDINIGMAIRSAAIFGCSDAYIVGKRLYDKRSVVGADKYIHVHRYATIPTKTFFEDEKLIPILLEQGGEPLEDFNFKPYLPGYIPQGWKLVLIVGSENYGIPKEFMKTLGATKLSISQPGIMRSLNVCNAASIVLYEYMRQWRANARQRI